MAKVDDAKITNLDDLEISSHYEPGLFELLDSGQLDENDPDTGKMSVEEKDTQSFLIGSQLYTALDLTGLKGLFSAVIARMKGYEKKRNVWDRKPVWIPIIELYAPPEGIAEFEHTSTSEDKNGPEFKIVGINFGGSQIITLSRSISFQTTAARAFQLKCLRR
jgi:hypothetical protein